jgi:hypothetical protein
VRGRAQQVGAVRRYVVRTSPIPDYVRRTIDIRADFRKCAHVADARIYIGRSAPTIDDLKELGAGLPRREVHVGCLSLCEQGRKPSLYASSRWGQ